MVKVVVVAAVLTVVGLKLVVEDWAFALRTHKTAHTSTTQHTQRAHTLTHPAMSVDPTHTSSVHTQAHTKTQREE